MNYISLLTVAFARVLLGLGVLLAPLANAVADTSDACEVALGLGERRTGLGRRGFLGTLSDPTPAAFAALTDRAIMNWNVKIFVVRTEAEARAYHWLSARIADLQDKSALVRHADWAGLSGPALVESGVRHARETIANGREVVFNPLMTPLFIVDPTFDLDAATPAERERFRASIPGRTIFEIDDQDHLRALDAAATRARFDPAQITDTQYWPQEPRHFRQDGFFFPKVRGVLRLSDLDRSKSNTFKRLEKDFATRRRQGYLFSGNQDLVGVMRGAMAQQRSGQKVENNRIGEDTIRMYRELAKDGRALSLEAWEPDGHGGRRLIAGTFGTIVDGSVELETIFYPPGKPDFARFLFLMARDRLRAVSIEYIDAGMVSGFTRALKGAYYDADEFLDMFERRDRTATPDFTTPF